MVLLGLTLLLYQQLIQIQHLVEVKVQGQLQEVVVHPLLELH